MRRALAILLLVSLAPTVGLRASAQELSPDAGTFDGGYGDGGIAPAPVAETRPLVPSTQESAAVSMSPLREVPVATWICAGVAAALLGVGLGFGLTANDIDHRAGVNVAASGVDQGLTRRTALAGQTDATVANGFFIGAGVVALVGLAFAAFAPEPAARWETASPAKTP